MTSTEGKRVMIVEDEVILAMALEESLQRNNFEVVNISITAEEAIDSFVESDPDLVIMDISLGGPMNGIAASRHMMKEKDVPFVFLTSNTNAENIKAATESGSYAYLLKPYNEKQLIANLEIALLKFKANKALKDLVQSKDRFYSFISHDLRSPLAAITMSTGILKNKYDQLSKEDIKDFINDIHYSSNNLMTLTNNLFHWARIETGRVKVDIKEFDFSTVKEEVLNGLKEIAAEDNIEVSFNNTAGMLKTDPYLLSVILSNLLYSSLLIAKRSSRINIKSYIVDNEFCFSLQLIPELDKAKLELLSKLDFSAETNVRERNYSMSLAIVHKFLKKLGGRLASVTGQEGEILYNLVLNV